MSELLPAQGPNIQAKFVGVTHAKTNKAILSYLAFQKQKVTKLIIAPNRPSFVVVWVRCVVVWFGLVFETRSLCVSLTILFCRPG